MLTQADIELLEQHVDGTLADGGAERLRTLLRASSEARAMLRSLAALEFGLEDIAASGEVFEEAPDMVARESRGSFREPIVVDAGRRATRRRGPLAVAAVAALALFVAVFWLVPNGEPHVAKIAQLTGAVQWRSDAGEVVDDLEVGQALHGGTLESLSVDSSAKLVFPDGTAMTIPGECELTFLGEGQKILELRRGILFARVSPQPVGEPLVIHTPTAELRVLGTEFRLQVKAEETFLAVNEGRVRVEREMDGSVVEVPAAHQVVAMEDDPQGLRVTEQLDKTRSWNPNLEDDREAGRWNDYLVAYRRRLGVAVLEGTMTEEEADNRLDAFAARLGAEKGSLQAAPRRAREWAPDQEPGTRSDFAFLVSLSVSREASGPVVLAAGSRFRIRGSIRAESEFTVGFTALDTDDRVSSGRYTATKELQPGMFDVELELEEFQPSDGPGSRSASGLELVRWWCSIDSREAALEITSIRLDPR